MKPTLLIDGDQFLYEVASAHETEWNPHDDIWMMWTDFGLMKEALTARINGIMRKFSTHNLIFCLSDNENFRKEVLPTYKAKRKTVRKPMHYTELKEWAQTQYPSKLFPKLEADDVMGIIATQEATDYIIVSEDKDMQTVPTKVFRKGEIHTITEAEANWFFLYQTLCGDITDGYKGCPSIGDKTAIKLLEPYKMNGGFDLSLAWDAVVSAFEKAGLTEADALQQARCARILRASDWDATNETVKLWTP